MSVDGFEKNNSNRLYLLFWRLNAVLDEGLQGRYFGDWNR